MSDPFIKTREYSSIPQKGLANSSTLVQDLMARWMAIELREQEIDQLEQEVEEEASRLETHIRAFAQIPHKLRENKTKLERCALAIRERREAITRARQKIDNERRAFWERRQRDKKETWVVDREPRAKIGMSVAISPQSEHNFWTGLTQDIAEGGVFIATYKRLPVGTLLELTLSMPDHSTMRLCGEVRWLREYSDFTADVSPGFGVKFVDLPEDARWAINAFILTNPPLLF